MIDAVYMASRHAAIMLLAMCAGAAHAATLNVSSLADGGAGSLRQTIAGAGVNDTISMATLAGSITLFSPINVDKPLTILGPGADSLAIAGAGNTRLLNTSSAVTIRDVTLRNGVADATALVGGAIYNTGNLTLRRVVLRANTAVDGGGAIYNLSTGPGSGVLTLRACELSGNTVVSAQGIGGGALLSTSSVGSGATLYVINSTLNGNAASGALSPLSGGAIYASRGLVSIVSSTIDGNRSGASGANIYQGTVSGSSLAFRNSIIGDAVLDIVAANSDQDIFVPTGGSVSSLGYNIVQRRPATGFGASDAADGTPPGLSALANNGGTTFTMKPAVTSIAPGFVPLASCVDETGAPLFTDQRESLRRALGATTCDAGAYEYARLLASAYSQKLHSGIPYRLPLNGSASITGAVTVEPRVFGSGHTIVFTFASPVTSVGYARVVDETGAAVGTVTGPAISGNEVSVLLTGVGDGKRVAVQLFGVNGTVNTSVALGFLVGDVTSSRTIGNVQVSVEKAYAGQVVDASNFIYDLNLSGRISAAEIAAVKARNGNALP